ncbi:hypothetical protein Tco_1000795 [Tanacetum coccineum]
MLSNTGLGKEFWAEAVMYACHLVNRFPSTAIDGETPFEKESKLDPRAKKTLFMRITSGIKGYRLWCLETKKTIFSRDVTFNESAMLKKVNVEQLNGTSKKVEFERIIVPADREPDDNSPMVEGDYEEEKFQACGKLEGGLNIHVPQEVLRIADDKKIGGEGKLLEEETVCEVQKPIRSNSDVDEGELGALDGLGNGALVECMDVVNGVDDVKKKKIGVSFIGVLEVIIWREFMGRKWFENGMSLN